MLHTILGAGGAVGNELARALAASVIPVRLVSRNPRTVTGGETLFPADLLDGLQVMKAVEGSAVVYLCAGLPYKTSVWKASWPVVMDNVLHACQVHRARLVFMDNIYMYAPEALSRLTEFSPVAPCSEKGKVRAQIAAKLMERVEQGKIDALIARAADFYGPSVSTSMLKITVSDNLKKGKKAIWIADANRIHSFTFTPDIGRALALLGTTPDAFNQVWHLPTTAETLTGKEWIEKIAGAMGVAPAYRVMPPFMLGLLGLFIPVLGELKEMVYQQQRDYFFDSSKFSARFGISATPVDEGIRAMLSAPGD